ncbi:hypothetical protein D8674_034615 [Pyrus ussuriensis x Pyrus communis]|uniref:Uncharacterized protein n=1 Tax=Pyrus ussuriensis x Pyrus communis TaxID=2448454 RepID=A0A5N5GA26_9ROSA|nr:hypothetical protein D8674_034615 [Pyrus ussuriensis x Pyrus communis]
MMRKATRTRRVEMARESDDNRKRQREKATGRTTTLREGERESGSTNNSSLLLGFINPAYTMLNK